MNNLNNKTNLDDLAKTTAIRVSDIFKAYKVEGNSIDRLHQLDNCITEILKQRLREAHDSGRKLGREEQRRLNEELLGRTL